MKAQDNQPDGLSEKDVLAPCVKALIRGGEGKFLVLYRSATHPRYPHDVDLPGGVVGDTGHENEDFVAAVRREIKEETGLDIPAENCHLIDTWWCEGRRQNKWQQRGLVVCDIAGTPGVKISWEHESYAWVDFDRLVSLLKQGKHGVQVRNWRTLENYFLNKK
ncbi:MAG: NUDIX domain-containing protein [Candidatus Nomurabacteria bacterium]|jgi:8-oxo-dGTP pyrophosphatase MutT (NUDIX family)|nr:NUDIX domain-containing protein [Candidatus Nomurabacteria bacterium]